MGEVGRPASLAFSVDEPRLADDSENPDSLNYFTRGQIRRILENSAINDHLTKTIPELARVIAHSSHTTATLARAWSEFQQATRDAYGLHLGQRAWWEFFSRQDLGSCPQENAVEIKLSRADDAWCLITNGEPELRQDALAARQTVL
jgi:hypothetical protein